jgi:hypothetical protein
MAYSLQLVPRIEQRTLVCNHVIKVYGSGIMSGYENGDVRGEFVQGRCTYSQWAFGCVVSGRCTLNDARDDQCNQGSFDNHGMFQGL